jgi:hypothetical protein
MITERKKTTERVSRSFLFRLGAVVSFIVLATWEAELLEPRSLRPA